MIGNIVKLRPPLLTFWLTVRLAAWPIVCLLALTPALAAAAALSHLSVRIVTGAEELTAGSYLELRIYEVGGRVRHLPLTSGESWPPDSTRVIPLNLSEPLDPRTVVRYSLYYRAGNALSRPWDIVWARDRRSAARRHTLRHHRPRGRTVHAGTHRQRASLQERRGLRRSSKLQWTRTLRPAERRRGCARLRQGRARRVSGQPAVHRGARLCGPGLAARPRATAARCDTAARRYLNACLNPARTGALRPGRRDRPLRSRGRSGSRDDVVDRFVIGIDSPLPHESFIHDREPCSRCAPLILRG